MAVGVSGAGSNLRALAAAATRGELGGGIVLVFADRPCPAIDWAADQGFRTTVIPAPRLSDRAAREAWDRQLREALDAEQPDIVVLAGFMRIFGRAVLEDFHADNRVVRLPM